MAAMITFERVRSQCYVASQDIVVANNADITPHSVLRSKVPELLAKGINELVTKTLSGYAVRDGEFSLLLHAKAGEHEEKFYIYGAPQGIGERAVECMEQNGFSNWLQLLHKEGSIDAYVNARIIVSNLSINCES